MPSGEKWSVNPVFAPTAPIAVSTDECAAIANAINGISVGSTLLSLNPPGVAVTGARVEARAADGELESVAEATRGTPAVGTSGVSHPFQTSIVLSLRTTDSTARGKGRLYWPACGIPMNSATLRITSSAVTDFVNGMSTYLGNLRLAVRSQAGLTTAGLVVWSRTNGSTRLVNSIRAGDVADVQRRRRDSLIESYTSLAFAP